VKKKNCQPKIDNRVKDTIAKCTTCQAVGQANPPEPLRMTEMPELLWRTVHIDFYGPLSSSEYTLVVVDIDTPESQRLRSFIRHEPQQSFQNLTKCSPSMAFLTPLYLTMVPILTEPSMYYM
jgi:hypothetical protein